MAFEAHIIHSSSVAGLARAQAGQDGTARTAMLMACSWVGYVTNVATAAWS